jgi:hypothetical protein
VFICSLSVCYLNEYLTPKKNSNCCKKKNSNSLEQGCRSSDVLAGPSELQKTVAVFHNPPMNVTGPSSCVPALSAVLRDLVLKLSALFLQPTVYFLELMLPCLQLLDGRSSQLWWG